MADSDNYLKILEKISEVREDSGILKTEVNHLKEGMGEIKTRLSAIEQQDIHQNRLLDEHIAGVQTTNKRLDIEIESRTRESELTKKQIEEIDMRLKRAEVLPKAFRITRKGIIWFVGFLAALASIATIGQSLHWF